MKLAADFRELARNALRGKWPVAVLTGFLASLMGALLVSNGGGTSGNNNDSSSISLADNLDLAPLRTALQVILGVLILWIIMNLIVSGAGKLGYAIFNLNLVDGKEARVSDLFSQFHRLGEGFVMNFLMALYTLLWSLLFVIPGIIKSYSYAMTPYIMAEHPALTADEAATLVKSKVDTSMYSIQLLNDNLKVGNGRYYQFGAIYNQEFVSPFLVVDMVTGELYCYNST